MQTRKATKKDFPAVNKLSIQMHKFLAKPLGIKLTKDELEEEKYSGKDLKENEVFIALVKNRIVGYISFSRNIESNEFFGDYYEVHHMIIDEKFRGEGMGDKLLKIATEKAKKEGVNVLTEVLITNESALNFYKKAGFKAVEQKLVIDNQKRMKNI